MLNSLTLVATICQLPLKSLRSDTPDGTVGGVLVNSLMIVSKSPTRAGRLDIRK